MGEQITAAAARRVGAIRIGVGLAQGVSLYALFESVLHHAWPGAEPVAFAAFVASLIFAPLVLIGDLNTLRRRILIGWFVASIVVAASLAGYEAWRNIGSAMTLAETTGWILLKPSLAVVGVTLFIVNHLLEASEIDRRFVSAYTNYFEPAWKHGLQIVLALLFTAGLWGLLSLGGALFNLIHISVVAETIRRSWFAWPATTVAFAFAIHLTDVRVALVRSIREVALTLLSWLTPLLLLLTGGFVLTLPFTGLDPLWKTKAAATLLLSAASWLVVLINAAYQAGAEPPTTSLRWTVRAASVILIPLTALACVGIALRVRQYGLTPERMIAGAWALAGACYALGYSFAAVRPGAWMKPLELTNVVTAWVILAILGMLFTPLADPARLSVGEQVHRLETGRTKAAAFDYAFLRFRAARFGIAALKRLAAQRGDHFDAEIAGRAAEALNRQSPWEPAAATPANLIAHLVIYPKGRGLPTGFTSQDWVGEPALASCLGRNQTCDAYLIDLDNDGIPQVLINVFDRLTAYRRATDGRWRSVGFFATNNCDALFEALRRGDVKAVPAEPHADLEIAGQRLMFIPQSNPTTCPLQNGKTPHPDKAGPPLTAFQPRVVD